MFDRAITKDDIANIKEKMDILWYCYCFKFN